MSCCLHFMLLLLTFYTSYSATMKVSVDNTYVSSIAFTGSSATVTCQASEGEYLYSNEYFRLQQLEADNSYTDLVSIQVSELSNRALVVYLLGMVNKLSLRCYYEDPYRIFEKSFTIYPENSKMPDALAPPVSYTDAIITFTPTPTTPTTTPSNDFTITPSYIIYIIIITVFLLTFCLTASIACWLTFRIRINRARLLRARQDYTTAVQNSVASPPTHGDTVLITHMQRVRRQGMPPSYFESESHTSLAPINTHIDSAPPCYYEIAEAPLDDTINPRNHISDITPNLPDVREPSANATPTDNGNTLDAASSPLELVNEDDTTLFNNKPDDSIPTTVNNNNSANLLSDASAPDLESQVSIDSFESYGSETAHLITN